MTDRSNWSRREFLGAAAAVGVAGWSHGLRAQTFVPEIGITRALSDAPMLAEAGYDFIEGGVGSVLIPAKPDTDFEALQRDLKAARVPVKTCNTFLPGTPKIVGPEANHDAAAAYAETAIRRAGTSGIGIIVFGSGGARRVPDGFDHAEARRQFVAFAKRIAPAAQRAGVLLALEPLNRAEVNFILSVREGAGIVDEVAHPAFRLHADVYHMLQEDEGPEAIVAAGSRIVHVHVAQKGTRMAPLPGGTDFRPYFAALKQIGYRGRIAIESKWPEGENVFAAARTFVREQWLGA